MRTDMTRDFGGVRLGKAVAMAGLGLSLGLAGCSDGAAGPDEALAALDQDVALFVADAIDEELAIMGVTVPSGAAGAAGAAANLEIDLTVSRSRTFFDASGEVMDEYDRLLTASINTTTETSGSITRSGMELTIDRSRDLTVSGLEGEETERIWNGTGLDARTRARTTDMNGTRSYAFSGTTTIADVVRSVDRLNQPWPLSGTITRNVTIEIVDGPNGDETRTRTVVVTFDGTRFATLTVDGAVFEIDLAKRGRDRLRRGRRG